ncbi:high mobility group B protein 10-like [Lycium ferocissimum]|uniref:high mobility group B protein 10-like n=1 Tax=Lycium ferocissimum TaxID=112874 RepID=UPI0028151E86|nr:high mobility group B protein 10-like [Lycium ferocissimum]
MASSSADQNTQVLVRVAPKNYQYPPYPPPLAIYKNIEASPEVFVDTLKKLHASLGTKFMIPVIGGKTVDLHRLFVEVTTRGGIIKVLGDKRWEEVTSLFSFPSSESDASYILLNYYTSLLFHYERIYYHKEKYWTPPPDDEWLQVSRAPHHGLAAGSKDFRGVLNQVPTNQELPIHDIPTGEAASTTGVVPKKRRKTCDIKKLDPALPKRNNPDWTAAQSKGRRVEDGDRPGVTQQKATVLVCEPVQGRGPLCIKIRKVRG